LYKKNKSEITYFKNGFRYGHSKILRFNKLEEEGVYVNGLKHGTWKEYYYKHGTLQLTTEYKYGLKNGKEFGKLFSLGYFTCNYVDGVIDGPLLKYDFRGYLESKEYYEKGKKQYKHTYDDFLNITEEVNFSKNEGVTILLEKRKIKDDTYIDSLYYNDEAILSKKLSYVQEIPFKIKHYKNNKLYLQKEVHIEKDITRTGEKNYKFTFYYDDYVNDKQRTVSIYYDNSLNYNLNYNFCSTDTDMLFFWVTFKELYLYITYEKGGNTYEVHYTREYNETSVKCNQDIVEEGDTFKQTYNW